jgi:predicted enzyme related to lactoylglutathione lyase
LHQKITSAGGELLARRDMGSHGVVATYKDPEENIFQIFSKAPAR